MSQLSPTRNSRSRPLCGTIGFIALISAFFLATRHYGVVGRLGGHFPSAFGSFALLLVPYWAFGFGAAEPLTHALRSRAIRAIFPGLLLVPYLVFAIPRGEFALRYAVAFVLIPIGMAALFEFLPPQRYGERASFSWQDLVVLAAAGAPVEFRWLAGSWPGFSAMPKLLLLEAVLYAYLVVRRIDGVGYDFQPRLRDFRTGLREWTFFAPMGIGLGLALGFIRFHREMPAMGAAAGALLVTFFFVAIPEELFFRGLLLNLLEPRWGKLRAVAISSVIFGLSHFNKGALFNWRYVLLATLAGVFYARSWLDRRRLFSSAVTHTAVDVVWSLWFR